MASPQYNASSEPARIEQIITEFFAKSLHIILEARSPCVSSRSYNSGDCSASSTPSSSSTSSIRPRDKWFNLALRECPAALENLDWWRQSNLELLVVDVILVRRQCDPLTARPPLGSCLLRNLSAKEQYPNRWSPRQDEVASESNSEKVVERWIVQYERQKCAARDSNAGSRTSTGRASHSPEMSAAYKKTYRRSIVLMRSLYTIIRLLPSYKVFRDINSTGKIHPFSLTNKISSFVEPFTRKEDAEMNQFSFVPVDTPCGRLCLSVSYLPSLEDVVSEPSTPLSPQFITDYVGSPLADPLKRIQSLPTYVPFSRRHSWSYDQGATSSVSPSPSPTYSEPRVYQNSLTISPHTHANTNNSPNMQLILCNTSQQHRNTTAFDEYWPSPPFSPSSSPSPPTHLPVRNPSSALRRTESSPIKIPASGSSGGVCSGFPPTPSPKGTRLRCSYQPESARPQVSGRSFSPESMSRQKQEGGASEAGRALQKVHSFGKECKDGVGPFPGAKIRSCCSPRVQYSRSSNRLSSLDDYDDSEFTWPFAVEYDDIRVEPSGDKGHANEASESGKLQDARRSQDAAIGALVHMLKKAPPLHRDSSDLVKTSQISTCENWEDEFGSNNSEPLANGILASGLLKSRTTVDAMEELRSYREMKELLLKQGGYS